MSRPNFIAASYRNFSLMPHFKGKSRLEAIIEPFIPLNDEEPIEFPEGFKLSINAKSGHEKTYYFRNKEPDTFEYIKSFLKPGMCFWDCGANIGFYSMLAAARVGDSGKVCAFEPTPSTMERLKANAKLNSFQNIQYCNFALGKEPGRAEIFQQNESNSGENALRATKKDSTAISVCEIKCIDTLIEAGELPIPQLIKADVEGSEMDLLKGGETFFKRHRPHIIMEIAHSTLKHFGYSSREMRQYLEAELGYELIWPHSGRMIYVQPEDQLPHEELLGKSHGSNYILNPK